jgi:ClpP class serine protease
MGWAERRVIVSEIEKARGSRVICYVTSDRENANAQVHKDVLPLFFQHLSAMDGAQKVDLLLHTSGGDTLAGFGICRLVREFSPRVSVLVPLRCHSAGTLIALGADEIVMTRGATLSPIDPSIVGPLNPAVEVAPGQRQMVPLSVETVAGFKDLVTKDWDMKGEQALTAAFKVLAERVHPLALGDVYRARQQIEDLARKLLECHRKDEEVVSQIVRTLTRGLGSHDYPISKSDARSLLGEQVAAPDPAIESLIWRVFEDFSKEMQLTEPFDPNLILHAARRSSSQGPVQANAILAVVETTKRRDVAERSMVLTEIIHPATGGKAVQAEVVQAGWKREEHKGAL